MIVPLSGIRVVPKAEKLGQKGEIYDEVVEEAFFRIFS
jgi:hypothetical protein